MRIEHIALYVNDLEGARLFFERYFDAKSSALYHNTKTSFKSYFLSFDDGARLEIMTRDGLNDRGKDPMATGFIHLAFSVNSKDAVDALTKRFKDDGFEVVSGPRTTGDGYYESVILGFENNLIEITE